jgi:alanine dehydrogenase
MTVVGVLREVKDGEYRVALTPAGTAELIRRGHTVLVERGAGAGARILDEDFAAAGARIMPDPASVAAEAALVLKVKEPVREESQWLRPGLALFTYLHLAANPDLAKALLMAGVLGIAYETVAAPDGSLPLLAPMSQIAGRMAPQAAASALQASGGRGVLLGGVPGVPPAKVAILGAGVVGTNAARIAHGMGADVIVADRDISKLTRIDQATGGAIRTLAVGSSQAVSDAVVEADVVVGAVLVPAAAAPRVITEPMVKAMRPGSVIVDVSIDQGGCAATSRMTTHSDPVYTAHDIVHYCVGNMPGAVPRTATYALTNATLPHVLALADESPETAIQRHRDLAAGVNTYGGRLCEPSVAGALGLPYTPLDELTGPGGSASTHAEGA